MLYWTLRRWRDDRGLGLLGALAVLFLLVLLVITGMTYFNWNRPVRVDELVDTLERESAEAALTAKVKAALALSKHVSATAIDVDAEGQAVRLTGTVPSAEVRKLAEQIALETEGVETVQNDLTVEGSPGQRQSGSRAAPRLDAEIQSAVRSAIAGNHDLAGASVRVESGVVTLEGALATPAQKHKAEQTAWAASDGIQGVNNRIAVSSSAGASSAARAHASSEESLTDRVEFELYRTRAFAAEAVQVQVRGGTVTLNGQVRNQAENVLAERVAEDVQGVERVQNNLSLLVARYQEKR